MQHLLYFFPLPHGQGAFPPIMEPPYRFAQHPQYIALTLFGVGLLLAWGRATEAPLDALFAPGGRDLLGAFKAELDFAVDPPADPVTGVSTIGPRRDLEERWRFFLSGL